MNPERHKPKYNYYDMAEAFVQGAQVFAGGLTEALENGEKAPLEADPDNLRALFDAWLAAKK